MSDPADPTVPLLERALLALGGCVWIGNNVKMAAFDPDTHDPIHQQAMSDARVVIVAIKEAQEAGAVIVTEEKLAAALRVIPVPSTYEEWQTRVDASYEDDAATIFAAIREQDE